MRNQGQKNVTHVTFEASTPAATPCAVRCAPRDCPFRSTAVLISFIFEPRNSKMVLFVPETCPRNAKRGFFVTFNANFYLRNRKLLLRRCKLPRGRLRWCRLLVSKLPCGRLRLRRCNLLRGRLPWRMVLGNVAKDTPLGLDTGGGG